MRKLVEQRDGPYHCQCGVWCRNRGHWVCDAVVGSGTCNVPVCNGHVTHRSELIKLCPAHAHGHRPRRG